MSRLSNTAAWILSGALFLVVVAWTNLTGLGIGSHPLTYDDVALPRFAVALIGAAAVWLVLATMLYKGNQLLWDPTWALLGALAAWAIISGLFANTPLVWLGQSERLEGVVTVVLYAVLFGAGLQLGRSQRYTRRLAAALVLGASVLAVHGLLQTFLLDPTDYTISAAAFYLGSAFASLGNPNFLAGLLVLALPIAVGLALGAGRALVRVAWGASALLALGALYATYSQGSWLAAVIELGLGVGVWVWSRQASKRPEAEGEPGVDDAAAPASRRPLLRAVAVVAAIVVLGAVIIIGVTGIATSAGNRLWGSSLKETGSGRVLLTQTTLQAAAARPLLGYGPDNYLAAFRLNRPERWVTAFGQMSTSSNSHSWPLQYAATLGILGALLLVLAMGWGFVRGRPRSALSLEEPAGIIATAIWIGVIGYAVQMMLNVAMLASTVPFWVLLGAICAPQARRVAVPKAAGVGAIALCVLLLVGAIVGSGRLLAADAAFMSARLAYNGDTAGDSVALAEKAAALNPLSVKYARAVAQARSAVLLNSLADKSLTPDEARALYTDAKAAFDVVLAKAPNDYAAHSWLAGLQAAAGTYLDDPALLEAATVTAEKAAKLDLTHWGVALILKGDTSLAAARLAVSEPGLP